MMSFSGLVLGISGVAWLLSTDIFAVHEDLRVQLEIE